MSRVEARPEARRAPFVWAAILICLVAGASVWLAWRQVNPAVTIAHTRNYDTDISPVSLTSGLAEQDFLASDLARVDVLVAADVPGKFSYELTSSKGDHRNGTVSVLAATDAVPQWSSIIFPIVIGQGVQFRLTLTSQDQAAHVRVFGTRDDRFPDGRATYTPNDPAATDVPRIADLAIGTYTAKGSRDLVQTATERQSVFTPRILHLKGLAALAIAALVLVIFLFGVLARTVLGPLRPGVIAAWLLVLAAVPLIAVELGDRIQ